MKIKVLKLKLISFVQVLPLILIFILGALNDVDAQVIKPFTQRTSVYSPTQKMYHIKGDYTMVGNTNLTPVVYSITTNNNDGSMKYVDIDGVDSTVNSSSATLNFSTENGSLPECSKIIYAGLYWTGRALDYAPSPNTFNVSQTLPQSINQNYTESHANSINNTDYTVSVTRIGTNFIYGVRYTFTSSGSGPQVLFESAFTFPYVRYSTDNGSTWTSPGSQVATVPGSNLRDVSFNPVTVYAPGGGIILTVNKLRRDSRGDLNMPAYQLNATASGNVSGTAQVIYTRSLDKRKIKLKAAGQPYTEFTANANDINYPTTTEDFIYSACVEVTDYVKANKSSEYSVADIALKEGYGGGAGYFGGWGMIVIFENSKMNWRDITIFDGYAYVDNTNSFELPVSGFNTAQAGNVNFKLGLMGGEGDVDFSGDFFSIIDQSNAWVPLNHTGNSTTNFFNSSINTGGNSRNPSLQNNTGVDLSMFNIPNVNNSVITNNQTSTKFKYGSTQDRYIISVIAMAVDACYPSVEPLISAATINGLPAGPPPLTILPGQDIEYKLEIRNQGTEAIGNTKIIIPMPYSATYVNGSAVKNVYFTPLPSPNNLYFDPLLGATGSLVWDFGTLPKPADVNTLLATLTFHMKVTADCNILKNSSCPPNVSLSGAIMNGQGQTSGITIGDQSFIQGYSENGNCQGEPIIDPLQIDIDKTDYITQNCQGTPVQKDFLFCNVSANIPIANVSGSFPTGTRFYNSFPITGASIEYTASNPFPYTSGTTMYYAVPPGGGACHFDFTITVKTVISTPTANNVRYCLNQAALPLTAIVSDPAYTLYYFLTSTSTPAFLSITPSTTSIGVTTYYVAEGLTNACISPNRVPLTVSVFDFKASITSQTNVFCNGGNTGSATVTPTGGNGSYSYSWNTTPVQTTATAINLNAGSYTVTVTDNNGCTIPVTKVATITQPSSVLGASITSQTNVFCNGGNTGVATVTATGGSGAYSYSWNTTPVKTTATANSLAAGSYTVTVSDNNGCTVPVTKVATITQPSAVLGASITSQTNVFCNGGNTGTATVTATGGSGAYSYSWNTTPVKTTAAANSLAAGSYTVTVTDNNGCTVPVTKVASITQPSAVLGANITSQTNVFCNGGNTGTATVTATGGSGAYSYSWNTTPVQTTATAINLSAGSYTVTVTDNNGCTVLVTKVATITQPSSVLGASITSQTNVFCNGGNTGTATVTATGGSGAYSYSWNTTPVQTTATANNLAAGSYTAAVTDNNGCTVPVTKVGTITQPSSVLGASITSQTNVFCNGGNTGSATVTAIGGSGSYSYTWNTTPVQTTATAINLNVGSYIVTVTDNNGCTVPVTKVAIITQPSAVLGSSITSQTNVFCNGGSTGTATVTATGGSGAYSYSWNTTPVQTTATANGLAAGSYTVTVTDNNGCTVPVTKVATITQPSAVLGASIASQANVFCNGGNTGTATVTATGGSGAYSYSWNTTPVQTTATANSLATGSYTVTVTDNNGCTVPVTKVATITQPSSVLGASITSQTNVFCNGGNTGTATITATGGSGAYSYSWNTTPVQTTATAINLSLGSYTVAVTDNNGCTVPVTKVATITQPSSVLGAGITSQTNVFCNGGNTGTAIVTATGGSGAYSYSWNTTPIQTTATATNLSAGSYTVTVTDNNGCSVPVTKVATITQPSSVLGASISSQINVFCNGSNTGSATVTATGGSGAYSYSWNTTPIQTTATAINLSAGSYTVTVTDNNGCTVPVTKVATIAQPTSVLGASIASQTNVFCNGSNTGTATVTATGGSGAYSYSWNTTPVQTTATANSLATGSYTVTVTDNNGCTVPVTKVATITQPSSVLGASITSQTNVFCNGSNTGSATATATGGSGAYSYSWNTTPIQTTATANNLTSGSYTVTITDNNGCTIPVTKVATITQPTSVLGASITSQTNVFCNGGNTGTATVTSTGGSGTYSYSWNTTPIQTTATAINLSAGSYTVTVTDNNGCTVPVTKVATITQPSSVLGANIFSQTNVFCNGGNTGVATVTATGGSGAYSYSWNTTPAQTTAIATNLIAGSYTVTVTDNNGCTVPVTSVATITQPVSVLAASISQQTNVFCNGGNTGSAIVTGAGGSGSYSYSWNTTPVQTTATSINLTEGSYTVTVTDNNGCTSPVTSVATITQPVSVLASSIIQQTNVFCNGGRTGEATVTGTGGSGSYSYSWNTSPVQTTATATNLTEGSYIVTVTDNNGCTIPVTSVATITQPVSVLASSIDQQTNVFCNGGSTGSATVTASGGSGSYSYLWNSTPLQIGATAINLSAASYTVTVTDNNGCTVPVTSVTTITQPVSVLSASISQHTDVFCFGCNTGSVTVAASGGSGSYSYSWNTNPVQTTATANNLAAGSYTVTVTDNNGCTIPVTVIATISEPGSVLGAFISSQTNVFCFGGNTGEATVTAIGGSGSYSYSWNTTPVQTTAKATNLTAGSYTVTVTDNNGSSITVMAIATITQPLSGLTANISSQTNVFCNGGNTGNATLTASGGSGSYNYLWNSTPLQIGATAVNLSAGSYTVTITDNNGCTVPVTAVATITEPVSVLAASIDQQTNVFCNGGSTGDAMVTATGGSGAYSYSWNTTPVQTIATATNLTAGSYTVTVTDNNGCTVPVIKVATITQPSSVLGASITSQTNVFCNGGSTGSALITATGGSGFYSYSWNTTPVQTTANATGLPMGSYTVTITDNNGCTVPVTKVVSITEPSLLLGASISSQTNVFCNGGNTGVATVTATGGSGSYSYSWNTTPVQTTATATNLSAGSYTVTVTDNNGCTIPVTKIATITQPLSTLGASISSQTNVFCNGGNTGSATITVTGGSGYYSYSWNTIPAQTTATANGLTRGTYTVTVTDNNGCTVPVTNVVSITQPSSVLGASISSQTNVFCNDANTGSATVLATGGSGSYSYSWNTSPAQTVATAVGLTMGTYTVTVTDNNGCTVPVTKVVTITQPSSGLGASISSQTNVFCKGSNTGSATVLVTGGSGSYSYSWNTTPAQTTATAIGLTVGTYTVTVTDNNGCTVPLTKIVTITQPSSVLGASISSQTNVFCNGGSTGSATVTATGGSGSYSYSWNTIPAQTTATASGLTSGSYNVTVTDNNGCVVPVMKVAIITQPSSVLGASISSQTDVFCNGGNTGNATVTAIGGSGSYSYSWNTIPAQTSATATGLLSGSYTVTVTDNNGCNVPVTKVVTITQPSSVLSASISSQTNVFCKGGRTGSATVTATGGSGSYSYSWSTVPIQTTTTASNLSAGSYTVTVTDNNGCTIPVNKIAFITQPASVLGASISSKTNVYCYGGNTGSATVTPTGGSGSYSYLWNTTPAQIGSTAVNLSSGSYTVTVTDNNGCTVPVSKVASITQPSSAFIASISSQTNVFCNGGNSGNATVTATGGSGSYSYSWNTTPAQTTATATNLTAGSYTITVTDNNGCTIPVIKIAIITQPLSILGASITSQTNVFCNGGSTGSATVTATGGSGSYSYLWNTTPSQTTATASGLPVGSYTLTVKDINGCTIPVTKVVTITEPNSALNASISSQTNVFCNGGNTGVAAVTAIGGSGSYAYFWNTSPAQTTATAIGLQAGSYTVTVTDNNGCLIPITKVATITQPALVLSANISSQTNVYCNGGNTGNAAVTASGGSGSYTYLWNTNPSQISETAINLSAGSYTVSVTDNNGCVVPANEVVTITQPVLALSANLSSKTDVFCSGGNTGTATITATGGSGAYSYSWNTLPVQTSATAVNLSSGSYTVTITDNNGCIQPVTIVATITEPASNINASITSQTNVLCFGDSIGNATVTATGGSGFYSYSWNTLPLQTIATANNLIAGSYTVTVTDNNGCTIPVTKVVTITEPTSALSVSITSQSNVLCFEEITGVATATVIGGSGNYSYLWNTVPAQIGETAINLGAGSYTVTVNDNNGCSIPVTAQVTIIQPTSILTVTAASPFFNSTNISCNGGSDGSINLTLSGGTMPYSFSWGGPGTFVSTDQNISGLGAGLYTVNVIDANGCLARTTITLIEPSIMASTVGSTPADCIKSNGTADLDVIGGTQPYNCIWSCGITQQNLIGVAGGVYTVNVIDANGCLIIDTVQVDEISNLSLSSIVNNVLCYGTSDGLIDINVKGTAPFTYSWSNGSTTEDLTGVSAGEYIVIINDAAGCTILDTISITQSPSIALNLTSTIYFDDFNVSSFQGTDGAIDLSVTGGHPIYTYSWSNNATTEDISNLTAGNYFVMVTDSLGCKMSGSIILAAPLPLEMPTGFSPNGDGKNDKFVIRGIEVYPNNHITIFNRWGNIVYQIDGYHNQWDGVNNKGNPVPVGTYFVIVEINNKEITLKGYVDLRRE
ncbi:MAG: gliding motility-associated C-terminal domain-containing protein [Bacteroidota bacterium]